MCGRSLTQFIRILFKFNFIILHDTTTGWILCQQHKPRTSKYHFTYDCKRILQTPKKIAYSLDFYQTNFTQKKKNKSREKIFHRKIKTSEFHREIEKMLSHKLDDEWYGNNQRHLITKKTWKTSTHNFFLFSTPGARWRTVLKVWSKDINCFFFRWMQ